jgi:hypothetical protein
MHRSIEASLAVMDADRFLRTGRVLGPSPSGPEDVYSRYAPHVFYVSSARGYDRPALGRDINSPVATIDYAIGLCTADRGDIIYVLPGHTETISAAAGIKMDIAGVSIIGIGRGTKRPIITLGTATTATFNVTAADCYIQGLRFVSAIDSLAQVLDLDEGNFIAEDCEFYGPSTFEVLNFVNMATTKDKFTFRRCHFKQDADPAGSDAGANTGVFYLVDTEDVLIEDCEFYGNFETAIVHNKTTAAKNVWFKNCHAYLALSTSVPFELVDGCTGAMLGGGIIAATVIDATVGSLYGTLGAGFFILQPASFGNDGGAEQGGIVITAAS